MTRFILVDHTWTTHGGEQRTAPVLINLDHVRRVSDTDVGRARIWWAIPDQTPLDLTISLDQLTELIMHVCLEAAP